MLPQFQDYCIQDCTYQLEEISHKMEEMESRKQACENIYSSLYIFIVLMVLQVRGENENKMLPHLYPTCNKWVGELLGTYYFCYFFWGLRHLPLDSTLGKDLMLRNYLVQCLLQ